MSTILDALRKAKQTPPEKSVDARREILSPQTHDYLAAAPSPIEDEVRFLKLMVVGAVSMVALLSVILVVVMLKGGNNTDGKTTKTGEGAELRSPESNSSVVPTAAPTAAPITVSTLAASAPRAPAAAPTPAAVVRIVVSTPAPPPPAAPGAAPAVKSLADDPAAALQVPPLPTTSNDPVAGQTFPREIEGGKAAVKSPREKAIDMLNEMRGDGIGIVWDDKEPMAMIKGRVIKKGSRIGTAEVVRITPDTIVFLIEGEEYSLGQ